MRQDKDCSSKWLLAHHADALLKLDGIMGFTGEMTRVCFGGYAISEPHRLRS